MLQRRDDDEGLSSRREMIGKPVHEARGDAAAVGPPIERKVVPPVGVPLFGPRGKVRGVREHSVESSESMGEVGPNDGELETVRPCFRYEATKRVRVEVGRDHARPASGCDQRCLAGTCSDLEEEGSPGDDRELREKEGILSRRVDGQRLARGMRAGGTYGR